MVEISARITNTPCIAVRTYLSLITRAHDQDTAKHKYFK